MALQEDKKLMDEWINVYHRGMHNVRKAESEESEFYAQQNLYKSFASVYDKALILEKCTAPRATAEKVNTLLTSKSARILDFGCGTGLVAEYLVQFGYSNIDGVDASSEMVEQAKLKGNMKQLIVGSDSEGLKQLNSKSYDLVCSSGVFFLSASHPGTKCFEEIARVVKSGGYFVFVTKKSYLSCAYVNWDIVDDLKNRKVLELISEEYYDGYRSQFQHEGIEPSIAAVFVYKIL